VTAYRPKNLNLFTIHFPIPAIVSILHRLSGVALFVFIPLFIWLFAYSLTNDGFSVLQDWFEEPFIKGVIWLAFLPICFHLVAGIRHLLMDIHVGEQLALGRLNAILTFVVVIALMILIGIWLW
jgi:succinate dehydrogenase cytochrome b subunit